MTILFDAQIFTGSADISGQANSVTESWSANMIDTTSFGSSGWMEARPGNKSATLTVQTYLDDAIDAGQLEAGVRPLICTVAETAADGSDAYSLVGAVAETGREGTVGDLHRQPLTISNSGLAFGGKMLQPKAVRTVAGSATATLLEAVPSGRSVYASLHLFAVTGGNVNVLVESAALINMVGATTRINFGTLTAAQAVQSSSSTVTTDTFWRVRWTQTASSATFAVVVGIH